MFYFLLFCILFLLTVCSLANFTNPCKSPSLPSLSPSSPQFKFFQLSSQNLHILWTSGSASSPSCLRLTISSLWGLFLSPSIPAPSVTISDVAWSALPSKLLVLASNKGFLYMYYLYLYILYKIYICQDLSLWQAIMEEMCSHKWTSEKLSRKTYIHQGNQLPPLQASSLNPS